MSYVIAVSKGSRHGFLVAELNGSYRMEESAANEDVWTFESADDANIEITYAVQHGNPFDSYKVNNLYDVMPVVPRRR